MSRFWSPITHDPISSAQFRQAFDDVENLTDVAIGQGIISGLEISSSVGLNLTIASGIAVFAGGYFNFLSDSITLINNSTNHVYLVSTYVSATRTYTVTLQSNITGIAPASSLKLGTVITSSGTISSSNFNSTGNRGINLLSLEQLSIIVPSIVSSTGNYLPWSATGALISAIAQGVSSGAYLTTYQWSQASGSYLTKTQYAITSGAFQSLSGSFATKVEVASVTGSLDSRLYIVENTYVTKPIFAVTSGTVVQLQSQTGSYFLKSSSGMFATSSSVAALASAVSLMFLKTEFASLSGSLYLKSEFSSTSGAFYLRTEFSSVSGQFIGINILGAVSGNLIPWTSSGAFAPSGLVSRVTYLESLTGNYLTLGQYAATSGTGGGGSGNYFNLNNLTGSVTLSGSGGTTLIQSGQNLYIYSPTGYMLDSTFNSISGSYLLRSEYASSSGTTNRVISLNNVSGTINLIASGATSIGVSGNNILINTPSVDLSPYLLQSNYASTSGTTFVMPFLLGYTPSTSGFDSIELPVPYLQSGPGNTPSNYTLKRIVTTCTIPGTVTVMTIYKASSGTAMSTSNSVGSITLPLNAYQAHSTSGLGTFSSSDRLRLYTNTVGTTTNLTVTIEFSPS